MKFQAKLNGRIFNLTDITTTPFTVTMQDCRYWTFVITHLAFGGELPPFRRIYIKKLKSWGYCHGRTAQRGKKNRYSELYMCNEYPNFSHFFTVLIHETAHHADWVHTGVMTHGPKFFEWRKRLACITYV